MKETQRIEYTIHDDTVPASWADYRNVAFEILVTGGITRKQFVSDMLRSALTVAECSARVCTSRASSQFPPIDHTAS